MRRRYVNFAQARPLIWNGDHLLFLRDNSLIARHSDGPHSHGGIAVWRASAVGATLSCAHSREWQGATVESLRGLVRTNNRCIDVYRPLCTHETREWIAELAYRHAGHRYNWPGIVRASLLRMPLVRLALNYNPDVTKDAATNWSTPKFCSQQMIWCDREAGRITGTQFDPVPAKGDCWVTPNDLGHSAVMLYQFTLESGPAEKGPTYQCCA